MKTDLKLICLIAVAAVIFGCRTNNKISTTSQSSKASILDEKNIQAEKSEDASDSDDTQESPGVVPEVPSSADGDSNNALAHGQSEEHSVTGADDVDPTKKADSDSDGNDANPDPVESESDSGSDTDEYESDSDVDSTDEEDDQDTDPEFDLGVGSDDAEDDTEDESNPPIDCGTLADDDETNDRGLRALHGAKASRHWPWQVLLRKIGTSHKRASDRKEHCGATVIPMRKGKTTKSRFIITAASCVSKVTRDGIVDLDGELEAVAGMQGVKELDTSDHQVWRVKRIRRPEEYKGDPSVANIALLETEESFKFNKKVRSICIPKPKSKLPVGRTCVISGYNGAKKDAVADWLQDLDMTILDPEVCGNHETGWGRFFNSKTMTCASGKGRPCDVDSGGPLACEMHDRYYLISNIITKAGSSCTPSKRPELFLLMSYFADWIRQTIRQWTRGSEAHQLPPPKQRPDYYDEDVTGDDVTGPFRCDRQPDSIKSRSFHYSDSPGNRGVRLLHGGENAKQRYPWQVMLRKVTGTRALGHEGICSATLLLPIEDDDYKSDILITAASCVTKIENDWLVKTDEKLEVVAGMYDLSDENESGRQVKEVGEIFPHRYYTGDPSRKNIALLQLKKPLEFSETVWGLCLQKSLLDQDRKLIIENLNKKCIMTGFSDTNGQMADRMQEAQVKLRHPDMCKQKWKDVFDKTTMMCTEGASRACKIDVGGTLACPSKQGYIFAGTIINTDTENDCAPADKESLFLRMSEYIGWVQKVLKLLKHRKSLAPLKSQSE